MSVRCPSEEGRRKKREEGGRGKKEEGRTDILHHCQ
jgi:hypothetical protein